MFKDWTMDDDRLDAHGFLFATKTVGWSIGSTSKQKHTQQDAD